MERQAERAAFAKACAYLNYSPAAKWTAHIAAIGTGVVYVALLLVLWLFADLMVSRGRLPRYEDLTTAQQDNFRQRWSSLPAEKQGERLRAAGGVGFKLTDKSLAALREAEVPDAHVSARFKLTDKSLAALRQAKVAEPVVAKFSSLKDQVFDTREAFVRQLAAKLDKGELANNQDRVVDQALVATWYKLNGKALASLREAGVSEPALEKLSSLKDQPFEDREAFLKALSEKLDKEEFAQYQDRIVNNALQEGRFKLTDRSLASLRAAGVPEPVLAKLVPLKDQAFDGRRNFSKAISEKLDKDELASYQGRVAAQALVSLSALKGKELDTENSFLAALEDVFTKGEIDHFKNTLLDQGAVGAVDTESSRDWEAKWKANVRQVIAERVSPAAVPSDHRANVGIVSLIVREDLDGRYITPVLAWVARWNSWMWNFDQRTSVFPPYLIGLLLVAIVLGLLGGFLTLVQRESSARATIEAATRLRRAVYHHTFRLGTLAFRALGASEAISLFARHVEAIHDSLYTRMTVMVREPVKFLLLLLFALALQFWLAVAFLLFAVLVWLLGGQVTSHFRRQGRLATHQAGERLTIMRESLMLMRLVKCYIMETFNQARVERQLAIYSKETLVRLRGEAIYQPLLVFLGLFCGLILLFFAGALVLGGEFSVASVVALATGLVSLYWPLEKVLAARRILRRGQESAVPVFKFLERRREVGEVVGAEFLQPLAKQIEFDNVTLREPGSSRVLLEEVSLTIPAGNKIGIVGADDLEKHSLVYLIPRLLDPTTGEIRIDQHNLRWVTLDSLRAQIGTVLMHNLVFHDTVANNIGCGDPGYKLPQIIDAAKVAHAHHFIQKLPQGYETPIGELGHSLTISEQFRIALARAILRQPALLIIEEPEAAMDEDTKALLDDTFARILPQLTVIFLPHRISTLRSCDTLYLLHKGRIIASGTHKELLASNQLYRHQHYLEFAEVAEPA